MITFSDFSLSCVNIFRFLFSSVTVSAISLGCGRKEAFEDTTLGYGKKRWALFTNFWLVMDQTTNLFIKKISKRLITCANNHEVMFLIFLLIHFKVNNPLSAVYEAGPDVRLEWTPSPQSVASFCSVPPVTNSAYINPKHIQRLSCSLQPKNRVLVSR